MIEGLKPLYNTVLRPVLTVLLRIGLHPNQVTLAGTALFAGAGIASATDHWIVGALCAIVGALFDGLDGMLARESGKISRFGGILDSVCDRVTEIFLLGGLLWFYHHTPTMGSMGALSAFAAITGSLMVSYVKARCEGAGIECRGGLMQRPERIIVLIVLLLCGPNIMVWGLWGLSILAYYTVVERMFIAWRQCGRSA